MEPAGQLLALSCKLAMLAAQAHSRSAVWMSRSALPLVRDEQA